MCKIKAYIFLIYKLAGLLYVWLVAGGYFVTKYVVGML